MGRTLPIAIAAYLVLLPDICRAQETPPDASRTELQRNLAASIFVGDREAVHDLIGRGVSLDFISEYGMTPVQIARVRGYPSILSDLLSAGADSASAPDYGRAIDAILEVLLSRPETPGVAVLVTRGGERIYGTTRGLANVGGEQPVTSETTFRIGSITKPFTAAAILSLVDKGLLDISDTVSDFIPDFPRGNEITIHHLLSHTSGIYDFTHADDLAEFLLSNATEEDVLRRITRGPSAFEPGDGFAYNNSGYFLLGLITEIVGSQPLGDYLQSEFFGRLGMDHTTAHPNAVGPERMAVGYSYSEGVASRTPDYNWSLLGGSGVLFSTIGDLARWNEAVFVEGLFQDAALSEAYVTAHSYDGDDGYAYGWWIKELRGLPHVGHGGRIFGYKTYLGRFPEQDLTIIVLHNSYPVVGDLDPERLASVIAEICLWEQMAPREVE